MIFGQSTGLGHEVMENLFFLSRLRCWCYSSNHGLRDSSIYLVCHVAVLSLAEFILCTVVVCVRYSFIDVTLTNRFWANRWASAMGAMVYRFSFDSILTIHNKLRYFSLSKINTIQIITPFCSTLYILTIVCAVQNPSEKMILV